MKHLDLLTKNIPPQVCNKFTHLLKSLILMLVCTTISINTYAQNCNLSVNAGPDISICDQGGQEIELMANVMGASNCTDVINSYQIIDSDPICSNITGTGVIFQKGQNGNCDGNHIPWKAGDDLIFVEFADGTAEITGTITNNGQIGQVQVFLSNKQTFGDAWNVYCYTNMLGGQQSFYQNYQGTITINGESFTVQQHSPGTDLILANGANNQDNQFGFGAWSTGSFGICTEWFGTLIPIDNPINQNNEVTYEWTGPGITSNEQTITATEPGVYTFTFTDCNGCVASDQVTVTATNLTLDLGPDIPCTGQDIEITADVMGASTCREITNAYQIVDSDPACSNITGTGVVFQNGQNGDCNGNHIPWKAGDDLIFVEYADGTAEITGTITNNGQTGQVQIFLSDKRTTGDAWNVSCYTNMLGSQRDYYRNYQGTITINGQSFTVQQHSPGTDLILANGANNQNNQFGFGAWSTGSFGICTEWFGTLVPIGNPNVQNNQTYEWTGPNGFTSDGQTITVTEPGIYTVKFTDCNGCMIMDEIEITPCDNPVSVAGLGDYTWIDADRDGLQGADESPLANVTVNLYDDESRTTIISTTLSDQNGFYEFTDLDPDKEYFVEFNTSTVEIDGLFFITDAGNGASAGNPNDSDADPVSGATDAINLEPGEFDSTIDAGFFCVSCVLNLRVRLQGASNGDGGIMNDELRESQMIPLEQPFGGPKFGYLGTEVLSQDVLDNNGENSIVEWILVGLRQSSDPTKTVERRAALLQRDGDIVDIDGESPLYVGDMSGNYHISLQHRNHMGVMTAAPLSINNGAEVDFTNPNTQTYGNQAQITIGGKREMWCGEINGDGQLIFQGANNDANSIFFEILTDPQNTNGQINYIKSGYSIGDLNLDNQVIYQGNSNDANPIFFNILLHPGNTSLSPSYIVKEQLPE